MLFPRTKLVESFQEFLLNNEKQYICLFGVRGIGKTTFLKLLKDGWILWEATQYVFLSTWEELKDMNLDEKNQKILVIDGDISPSFSKIRTFIEQYSINSTVIFTQNRKIDEESVENFEVPGISFREYADWNNVSIDIGKIVQKVIDINFLNTLRDTYIHTGQYGWNIENPENIDIFFENKIAEMNQELFEKEQSDFLEFVRTVAMGVWDLFKEERIAKLMGVSRRKVRKYTEILIKYNLVSAIGPFVENVETELSRHVKLYFRDLAYFCAALGVAYYHGTSKQWVIENFLFLELERKLSQTHEIRFYRKKSGSEISFILIEKGTGKLTPISVTTKNNPAIPPTQKIFDEAYGNKVDRYMILCDETIEQKMLWDKPLTILPHIAI